MNLAPIALFVYNRPIHTELTLKALFNNDLAKDSILYIFADGPKENATDSDLREINKTRNIIKNNHWCKDVIIDEKQKNIGLAGSIVAGITEILDKFDKIIVLEDDIITSPYFLKYMNDGLDIYENEFKVISIHAYNYPIYSKDLPETFFMKGADCWGWGTWKRGWKIFEPNSEKLYKNIMMRGLEMEFNRDNTYSYSNMLLDQINGKINSWAIRWHASAFLENKYTLYPKISIIYNSGLDNSGTHSGLQDYLNSKHWNNKKPVNITQIKRIKPNMLVMRRWKKYFQNLNNPKVEKKSLLDYLQTNILKKLKNK